VNYDKVYAENPAYFGNPFPEVIDYFKRQSKKGKLLDVGCGQGRNAIPLAELGYQVHAIDTSELAITQLEAQVKGKKINLKVNKIDLKEIVHIDHFDFILLDGLFHLYDHQLAKEEKMMRHLMANAHSSAKLVFCFADHGDSISNFREITSKYVSAEEKHIIYKYTEPVSKWEFATKYFFSVSHLRQ
jgi:2-polyprenyl-3-methyl-5-hydroxy-6-metoxy-1,4-benzoquinol methylase